MEASSHALYYDKLCGITFRSAIFTNLTGEHLDFHKSMNEYALSKAKLFSASKCGLYNMDDGYMATVASLAAGRTVTYSESDTNADIYTENHIFNRMNGFEYDLVGFGERVRINSPLCGGFNVYNTLAASSAALCDGIPPSLIARGIESVRSIPGRLEMLDTGNSPIKIYIDYAHTPDALEKVLDCIKKFKSDGQSLTLVFGCGGDRDRSKRKTMGQIASRYADLTVVTSDNSRSEKASDIISEILKGIDKERPYTVIESRKDAIEYAVENTPENGIVLLAGKGHEAYEIDISGKHCFNEKKIAADAVCKRFNKK
jgi:UDP-N-acetylmuramoyl-L-alanyl-D-glutamate--2,6-diaminopimelate ligase